MIIVIRRREREREKIKNKKTRKNKNRTSAERAYRDRTVKAIMVEDDLPHANRPVRVEPADVRVFYIYIYMSHAVCVIPTHEIICARFSTCAPLVVVVADDDVRSYETPTTTTTTDVFISSFARFRFVVFFTRITTSRSRRSRRRFSRSESAKPIFSKSFPRPVDGETRF